MQRSSPERGEAGAEDEARVDQIRVGDDAFLQDPLGFREIRPDQRVDQLAVTVGGAATVMDPVLPRGTGVAW